MSKTRQTRQGPLLQALAKLDEELTIDEKQRLGYFLTRGQKMPRKTHYKWARHGTKGR